MVKSNKATPKKQVSQSKKPATLDNFGIGKYCIIRADRSGIHAGVLVQRSGSDVVLRDSRRLWYWVAPQGVALSGVAQYGVAQTSKLDVVNPEMLISGVIEIIPCSQLAEESIRAHQGAS